VTDWDDLLKRADLGLGNWVTASFPGTCAECLAYYDEGEQIRYSEHAQGWVCEECGDV
jgi:hypothetical protein